MTKAEKVKALMDFFGYTRSEAIAELIDSGDYKSDSKLTKKSAKSTRKVKGFYD